MNKVLISGKVTFEEEVFYVRRDGKIRIIGTLLSNGLSLKARFGSKLYRFVETSREKTFLFEGYLSTFRSDEEGEVLILAVRDAYPFPSKKTVNICFVKGKVVNLKEGRTVYTFELEVSKGLFLSVCTDKSKGKPEEGCEAVAVGRLKEVSTGEIVLFADEMELMK